MTVFINIIRCTCMHYNRQLYSAYAEVWLGYLKSLLSIYKYKGADSLIAQNACFVMVFEGLYLSIKVLSKLK